MSASRIQTWRHGNFTIEPSQGRSLVFAAQIGMGSGERLYDLSHHRNHGTINGTTQVPCANGFHPIRGLNFNGTSDYIDLDRDDALKSLFDGPFTIAFRLIDGGATAGNYVGFAQGSGAANSDTAVYVSKVHLRWWTRAAGNIFNYSLASGDHHFAIVSRSSTDHELYVDGVSVATSSTNISGILNNSPRTRIGA